MNFIFSKKITFLAFLFSCAVFLSHCGGEAGTKVGNPPTSTTTQAFPTNFAVVSPFGGTETSGSVSQNLSSGHMRLATNPLGDTVSEINTILDGTVSADCTSDLENILNESVDASCYGPGIAYKNHPDAFPGAPDDGTLPPGDVGMWEEEDAQENQACAAAQLNSQLTGIAGQSLVVLKAVAGMLCVVNSNNLDLPDEDDEILDLTTEMAAAFEDKPVTTTDAKITYHKVSNTTDVMSTRVPLSDTKSAYDYALSYNFSGEDGVTHGVTIVLAHVPLDDSNTTYTGDITWKYNIEDNQQKNCPPDMSQGGAITYYKKSSEQIYFVADTAKYCEDNAAVFDATGILDPADAYDAGFNTDGWGNDWNTFSGNFNPDTLAGNYAYLWQAGHGDSHSRTFNITLEAADDDLLEGSAFFGYGKRAQESAAGNIDGMICNWTGPGNEHEPLQRLVQSQDISENADGLFDVDTSNITYMPTNSCDYDGTGTFTYDSDGDGTEDTNPSTAITNTLLSLDTDGNGSVDDTDGNGTPDVLEDKGFTLPAERDEFADL